MPLNNQQLFQAFKKQHFEEGTIVGGQQTIQPKPDKVVEWALLSIVEALWAINGHLAGLAATSRNRP